MKEQRYKYIYSRTRVTSNRPDLFVHEMREREIALIEAGATYQFKVQA